MWAEIKNDYYCEEDNYCTIDAWETDDDNEEGKVIAYVYPERVVYVDNASRTDEAVQNAITECQKHLRENDKFIKLTELLTVNHDLPDNVKYDVLKRSIDWIISGGARNHQYLQSQIDYIERYLKR